MPAIGIRSRALVLLNELKSLSNPKAVEGMAHYGINPENTLGVSIPTIRAMAKRAGKNHELAAELWASKIHGARILASMVDEPKRVTEEQMECWVRDFDSWDVCDQVCMNLFEDTPFAYQKAVQRSARDIETTNAVSCYHLMEVNALKLSTLKPL
ncbi:MAG TPA: DNA alkylation repair protein [Candidatus Aquicultor sp.]|jgi:3-methyladenine DNA glycosylase AlkD